jgi:hypothetical protein
MVWVPSDLVWLHCGFFVMDVLSSYHIWTFLLSVHSYIHLSICLSIHKFVCNPNPPCCPMDGRTERPYVMKGEGLARLGLMPHFPFPINPPTELRHRVPMTTIAMATINLMISLTFFSLCSVLSFFFMKTRHEKRWSC